MDLPLFYFILFYVNGIWPACESVRPIYAVPTEARRGHHITRDCSYRQLWDTLWGLGTKPDSLKEHPVLLTTEPSLSSPVLCFDRRMIKTYLSTKKWMILYCVLLRFFSDVLIHSDITRAGSEEEGERASHKQENWVRMREQHRPKAAWCHLPSCPRVCLLYAPNIDRPDVFIFCTALILSCKEKEML